LVQLKPRILNFGVTVAHESISTLGSLSDAIAISDYHAFVYNPSHLYVGTNTNDLQRRTQEIVDLIKKKGGIVVSILRPETAGDPFVDSVLGNVGTLLRGSVRAGAGSQMRVLRSAKGVSGPYFQILNGKLLFTAHLDLSENRITASEGSIFAVDSVGYPIAVEFLVGEGRVCFLPPPNNVTVDQFGAALAKIITTHFRKASQVDAPAWAGGIAVPGANIHDEEIAALRKRTEETAQLIGSLEDDRKKLLDYVQLLFGYGKGVLEPAVRSALRLIGFDVREPEEYEGEWDVELKEPHSGRTALGEVEGAESVIDVDKYRQLLDYIEQESLEGRDHKGILIGNGFRLLPPEAPERQNQFSDHAQRGAARNQFCLLPTTELFKAVCAVLESPQDEILKSGIRESLLSTTGPWAFVRENSDADIQHALKPTG